MTPIDLSKRDFLLCGGVAGLGLLTTACPFDGVTRDKAVRYTDIAVGYLKDITPIAQQLGGTQIVELIGKAIPALEKLKAALEDDKFTDAGNFFDNATSILGQIANALLQLQESDRRNTIIGILTAVQVTLRTVSLFVKAEMPATTTASIPSGVRAAATPKALLMAFEATRF